MIKARSGIGTDKMMIKARQTKVTTNALSQDTLSKDTVLCIQQKLPKQYCVRGSGNGNDVNLAK